MVFYIEKEGNYLILNKINKKEKVKFNDWFYFKEIDDKYLRSKINSLFLNEINNFFEKAEEKGLFNKKFLFKKYTFPLTQKKIINELIKNIKEKFDEEEKEIFKKLIYELDVDIETKLFIEKYEAIKEKEIKKAKKIAFDLEIWSEEFPNPNKDPIVMVSFYGREIKKVIVVENKNLDLHLIKEINKEKKMNYEIEIVKNEKELIIKTINILNKYDIIFTYNGDNFDFPFLKERGKKLNVGEDIIKKIEIRGIKDKKSTLKGKTHIDLFVFIKNIMSVTLKSELLNLDQVSKEILKEGKDNNWKFIKDINYLIPYNYKDAYLTYKLGLYYLPILIQISKITNQPLYKISRATYGKLVEYKLMKESRKYNQIIPNKPSFNEIKEREMISYEGAFVIEPKYGVYENIAVLDFQSLYPSIIVTYNICPTTYEGFRRIKKENIKKINLEIKDLEKDNCYLTPIIKYKGEYIQFKFRKEKGFIPCIIKELFEKRVKTKKEYKKLKEWFENNKEKLNENEKKEIEEKIKFLYGEQYSQKILINAMYGYLGYSRARWFSLECAMSITAFGRFFIKKIIEIAEKKGFKVIYGDTDSLFLVYKSKEELLNFLEYINNQILPGLIRLDLENFYKRGIFIPLKTREGGAKKKYALISEKGEIKIRGFETVRRDWAILTKEVQNKVIELILNNKVKEAVDYVKEIIKKLKEHKIEKEKLVIYTQLKKDLNEYESEGPHVKIAKILKEKGLNIQKGLIIGYIVGKGKGNIKDKVFLPNEEREYDEEYYINNQIIPAIERIFEVIGIDINEIKNEKKQIKLNVFFKSN